MREKQGIDETQDATAVEADEIDLLDDLMEEF